jgi:hypothetical protein
MIETTVSPTRMASPICIVISVYTVRSFTAVPPVFSGFRNSFETLFKPTFILRSFCEQKHSTLLGVRTRSAKIKQHVARDSRRVYLRPGSRAKNPATNELSPNRSKIHDTKSRCVDSSNFSSSSSIRSRIAWHCSSDVIFRPSLSVT